MCMKENVKCFKGTGNVVWENDNENFILDSSNRSRSMPIIVSIIFYFY